MKKLTLALAALFLFGSLAGCGSSATSGANADETEAAATPAVETGDENPVAEPANSETITLTGLADITPHNELIEFVAPQLEAQGIYIDIVSTASDSTWNEKVEVGEVDFNFHQHEPYMLESNEVNGFSLVNVGNIHVEPIAAYSDYYDSVDELPDDAKVVVPNDATNEYRALKILEEAGFIRLRGDLEELRASVQDIEEYLKPIDIVEIDSIQIIGISAEFDVYITNTNKALEAGLDTTKYLFRESADSPYANIISVASGRENDPAIIALVEALKSEETQAFILEQYNGAVIPYAE